MLQPVLLILQLDYEKLVTSPKSSEPAELDNVGILWVQIHIGPIIYESVVRVLFLSGTGS